MGTNGEPLYRTPTGNLRATKPINGEAATPANGGNDRLRLQHAGRRPTHGTPPALAHGGQTCEDPPGVRDGAFGQLYLAYLRDPDGNKICALHRMGQ